MWVIKTKYTSALYTGRMDEYPSRPCVVVFETKSQAMAVRHVIQSLRADAKTRPFQPLQVEKWPLHSIRSICNTNALDVVVMKEKPEYYPATREISDDVRLALYNLYMFGGNNH